ncbi:YdeI/OmpD-associated family protein [Tenacibaculum sp. TC6]|uniref:YdeI/OmpD-associated family protein n=1 Tax=Tenacibaculum sp. TC6 TaxID=3423223 RepID=UPI003D36AE2E
MISEVDSYLKNGCGRCSYFETPQCKVHTWTRELKLLRDLVLNCGLEETLKWSQPCYTFQGKNVVMVTAFKEYATLSFFKGSLLDDPYKILVAPGKNSQSVRQLRFTNPQKIVESTSILKEYIFSAIEIEKQGLTVDFKKEPESLPNELVVKFNELPDFKLAFEQLTPGRQRGYILYFSQPKQSKTRLSRIEKHIPSIFAGKGLHDR